jgi:VanZ family protein
VSIGGRRAPWIPVIAWTAAITLGSLTPDLPGPRLPDVGLHVAAYAVLALLIWRALFRDGRPAAVPLAAALAWGYGLVLEGAQALAPWRTSEWRDLLANAAGAAVVVVAAPLLKPLLTGWRRRP